MYIIAFFAFLYFFVFIVASIFGKIVHVRKIYDQSCCDLVIHARATSIKLINRNRGRSNLSVRINAERAMSGLLPFECRVRRADFCYADLQQPRETTFPSDNPDQYCFPCRFAAIWRP